MTSLGVFTFPAIFADFSVLEKASIPISNASVDKKGSEGSTICLRSLNSSHLTRWDVFCNIFSHRTVNREQYGIMIRIELERRITWVGHNVYATCINFLLNYIQWHLSLFKSIFFFLLMISICAPAVWITKINKCISETFFFTSFFIPTVQQRFAVIGDSSRAYPSNIACGIEE